MNVFLSYPKSIAKSVRSLDDKRLAEQIRECKLILDSAGKSNNPIVLHYTKDESQIKFLRYYAYKCCEEFYWRKGKAHQYQAFFPKVSYYPDNIRYTPIYVTGHKREKKQYVTTNPEEVGQLFKSKLVGKWLKDAEKPRYVTKWTGRPIPLFYITAIKELNTKALQEK